MIKFLGYLYSFFHISCMILQKNELFNTKQTFWEIQIILRIEYVELNNWIELNWWNTIYFNFVTCDLGLKRGGLIGKWIFN